MPGERTYFHGNVSNCSAGRGRGHTGPAGPPGPRNVRRLPDWGGPGSRESPSCSKTMIRGRGGTTGPPGCLPPAEAPGFRERPAGGPVLDRRSMMKALGLGAAAIAGPGLVAGCSSSGSGATHQDRVRGDETRGRPVLQQPGRQVQREPVARGSEPRLHLEPHRGIRARQSARHRLRQLQPDHVYLRRPGRAGRPGQPAAGQDHRPEHPGSRHPVRLLPWRDEHPALLRGRRGRHLQRGSVRQGRCFFRPDDLERIPRGVREVQVRGHYADLPDLR